jgi:hypothetical protein
MPQNKSGFLTVSTKYLPQIMQIIEHVLPVLLQRLEDFKSRGGKASLEERVAILEECTNNLTSIAKAVSSDATSISRRINTLLVMAVSALGISLVAIFAAFVR